MLNLAPWGILERSNPASTGAATPAAVPLADTYSTGEGDDGEVKKKDTNGRPDGTDKVPRALVCQCSPHPPRIDRPRTRKYPLCCYCAFVIGRPLGRNVWNAVLILLMLVRGPLRPLSPCPCLTGPRVRKTLCFDVPRFRCGVLRRYAAFLCHRPSVCGGFSRHPWREYL
jgi:hypothetical protein